MFVPRQSPPSPLEQRQLRAAEPMWPVWVALGVLALSTGSLVAVLVGFTGKALHANGWFWLAMTLGTIAGLIALAFQTRSQVTRRMQTALILSLVVHVLLTFVFKESFLAVLSQTGKAATATTKPMPTMPDYYLPSSTGATVQQAFEKPVETTHAETSKQVAVRSDAPAEFRSSYRPALQQTEADQVAEVTPIELQRQSQAAPRRVQEMSRLSRQDLSEAKLAAPRPVRAPEQKLKTPKQKRSQLEATAQKPARRRTDAPPPRRPSPAVEQSVQQATKATTGERALARASSSDSLQAPTFTTPTKNRPRRSQAVASRIAETHAEDLQPTNPAVTVPSSAADMPSASIDQPKAESEPAARLSQATSPPLRSRRSQDSPHSPSLTNPKTAAGQVAMVRRFDGTRRTSANLPASSASVTDIAAYAASRRSTPPAKTHGNADQIAGAAASTEAFSNSSSNTAKPLAAGNTGVARRSSARGASRFDRQSSESRETSGVADANATAATGSSTNRRRFQPSTDDNSGEFDLFETANSPAMRRSQRRTRVATRSGRANQVDSPSSPLPDQPDRLDGDADENSASEATAAESLEPNSGIDRVASRVRVRNHAAKGSGGMASRVAATSGIPSRRANRQSQLAHNAPERFLRKTEGGRASVSGTARDIHPAFARRTMRRTDPTNQGAVGQPSAEVEKSIEMGLAYLSSIQAEDGRWSLQKTTPAGVTDPDPIASIRADSAATGLALLSFLGAGYDHLEDRYANSVSHGLEYLIANQKPNGDLFATNAAGKNKGLWFYSHGIAAIALCEAYGMTGDPQLKEPAQKAIDFIAQSQHPERGGWRYDPNRMSDLSVSGWQLMAMRSAQLAGLNVPEDSITGVRRLLDSAQASPEDGSQYCYNPWGNDTEAGRYGPRPNITMTAVGLMMRLYTGWDKQRPDLRRGADRLIANLPNADSPPSFSGMENPRRDTYYWYSGTIVMYHLQGEHWQKWKQSLYPLLSSTQKRDGELVGSWAPRSPVPDRWALSAGRLYLTTLNLLSLEVHHRHLPLFSAGLDLAE